MMKNEFYIYLKLLAINPETGKSYQPLCHIQPQIAVNLYHYIHEFQRVEGDNSETYSGAIKEILRKTHAAWNCPVGWSIGMISTDEFFARDNPFYEPQKRFSGEFLYSPEIGKTEVDTGFMYRWALEALPTFKTGREAAG